MINNTDEATFNESNKYLYKITIKSELPMASSIVSFIKHSNYESLNTFSSYLKTTSKSFYCEYAEVYLSRIYSPNCDLKLWIIFEFGNLLHRFLDHATFLYIKACKDSEFK